MTADAATHPRPHGHRVRPVDGNALAGMLSGVFVGDATATTLVCGRCARSGPLAEAVVERDEDAAIVRCRGCTRTLMTILRVPGGAVTLRVAALAELTTTPPG